MNNKKDKFPEVKTKYEFMVFLEFVEKATGWERGKTPDTFYSKNGIEGITSLPTEICIKSYGDCYFHFDKILENQPVYICLGDNQYSDKENIFDDYNKNAIVLGPDFIRKLAIKNPELWWLFISSCSEKCNIRIDKDKKHLVLMAHKFPYIYSKIKVIPSLGISNISELSKIFEEDFKYNRRHSQETYVIIGNGVSVPFGSDLWSQLSDYLFDYLKPQYIDNGSLVKKAIGNSTFSTTAISKQVISADKFDDALYSCIYRKYEQSMHTEETLLRQISLTKMFDPNLKLITYNYDDFLEIDFNKYCHPGIDIKPVCNAKEDKKVREPKVRHVHGFFSFDRKTKKDVVLTQDEYYRTYRNSNWVVKIQEKALNNNCIYVGSSMSDLFQMSIIDKVREAYYRDSFRYMFIKPWKCYALLCFEGLSARDIASIYCYYLNKGVRIIFTTSYDELASKYSDIMS